MNQHTAIKRSAQAVLHETNLPREEANRLGERLADCLTQHYEDARSRYNAADPFEIGEAAAKEYVKCKLR